MTKKLITSEEAGFAYRHNKNITLIGDRISHLVSGYQIIVEHTAKRVSDIIGRKAVLETCCGNGSSTIHFARFFPHVYAVDIDPLRIKAARINIFKAGLSGKVTLLLGDIFDPSLIEKMVDQNSFGAVFTDVTWSMTGKYGKRPSSKDVAVDISKTTPSTKQLFDLLAPRITKNIVMKLPFKINRTQLRQLSPCEIEEIWINNEPKQLNIYFGSLARKIGETKVNL